MHVCGVHEHLLRRVDEVVADGAHHLVQDDHRRLRADDLTQPVVDALLLDRVRNVGL